MSSYKVWIINAQFQDLDNKYLTLQGVQVVGEIFSLEHNESFQASHNILR